MTVTADELFTRFCISNIRKYLVSVGSLKNYCPTSVVIYLQKC